jgi:hypothetical protein
VQVCMKNYPVEIDKLLRLGLQILWQSVVNLSDKYVLSLAVTDHVL